MPRALELIATHELLTARQVAALVDVPVLEVERAFEVLVDDKILTTHQPLAGPHEQSLGLVYALTRRGVRTTRATTIHGRRSPFTVAHDVLRNEVGVVLSLLDRQELLSLIRWETARTQLADAVWLVEKNRPVRVPLVADALAVVDAGEGETMLLFEVDRGTVSTKRMALRYRGYYAWWQEGGPVRRFGSKRLRVLTIVPDEARRERLRSAALDVTSGRGSGLFWFAEQTVANADRPDDLLAARWRVARADDALGDEALFPRPAASPSTPLSASAPELSSYA